MPLGDFLREVGRVMPPMREGVPTKAVSMSSLPRPIASKICAPWYDESSEMPILERILRTPASSALRVLTYASSTEMSLSAPDERA